MSLPIVSEMLSCLNPKLTKSQNPQVRQLMSTTSSVVRTSTMMMISLDDSSKEEFDTISHEMDESDDDLQEDEHDYEKKTFVAHHMQDTHNVRQGIAESAASSSQVGSTIGIALGSVSVFVIIVVAIIMLRRSQSRQSVSHGYVEVDPSASPEERHLANMQMNGYENPTYKYFEVQNNPKA
uniref:Beta-amyloid precursor protein C-terminal domain-containing protein n=1 Tax=Arion vulgaris TaxID=1028688 RepID=A0A0B7AWF2_9EUPU